LPVFNEDVVILGGGLHGGLAAIALSMLPRPPRTLLIEGSQRIAGNHVWSCHTTDVGGDRFLLDALPTVRWPGYSVRFPKVERSVALEYGSMHSSEFATRVHDIAEKTGIETRLGCPAEIVDEHHVQIQNGESISAEWIIDARGVSNSRADAPAGWQKFFGMEVDCEQPHGLKEPCVMDAVSVTQREGFHFIYTLPFSPTRVLIEDTYYADDPTLNEDQSVEVIQEYLASRSWTVKSILREERGALPIPFGRTAEPSVAESPAPTTVGWRGGWFHPTTGYSFGLGVQVAAAVARCWNDSRGRGRMELRRLAERIQRQGILVRRLNRLLFTAFAPGDRMYVLERFHRVLSDDAIARFYALAMARGDKCRLLVGRPPKGFSGRRWLASWWTEASH
jgi:lycopene beta-cyclase